MLPAGLAARELLRPHGIYEGETIKPGDRLPAAAENCFSSPRPGEPASPAAAGSPHAAARPRAHASASRVYQLQHVRQALDAAPPNPRPSDRWAHGKSRRHRQAATPRQGPAGNTSWKRQREGTKPVKPQHPTRNPMGPLTASATSQGSPLSTERHVRRRETLLPPPWSYWARHCSPASAPAGPAAPCPPPSPRQPSCFSLTTAQTALAGARAQQIRLRSRQRHRSSGGPEETRRDGPAVTLSVGPEEDVKQPWPLTASAVRSAGKLRRPTSNTATGTASSGREV